MILRYVKVVFLISLIQLVIKTAAADRLILLQTLFRHGDRTPLYATKNDPYQEWTWPVRFGELTTNGMAQHYQQGQKLKQRYIDELLFLRPAYNSSEVVVQSDDEDRTIASAACDFAGLYNNPAATYPDIPGWPTHWTPIPIRYYDDERVLDPGTDCPRTFEIQDELQMNEQFQRFLDERRPMFETITANSGSEILSLAMLRKFYDTTVCERAHNLTLPSWLTQALFDEMTDVVYQCRDFLDGLGGFDTDEHDELLMLRGGPLLKEMIENMQKAIKCRSEPCSRPLRYHAYSAHDNTIIAFLSVLGAKKAIIGGQNPDYASMVAVELWQADDGGYDVQIRYSANSQSPFLTITQKVTGCPSSDNFCQFETFHRRSLKYLPSDLDKQCEKQNLQRVKFSIANTGNSIQYRLTSTVEKTQSLTVDDLNFQLSNKIDRN